MATIKIPRSMLKKFAKSDEELKEKINLMGTPVESMTAEEVEVQILPNRSDCLSVQGFLRAFYAYTEKETGLKKYKLKKAEKNFKVKVESSVSEVRPYTACAIVKKLKFDDIKIKEIMDMQEKLHTTVGRNRKKVAIGIYPLDKISLPITFEARKPQEIKFRPLESDREMSALEILQRHPTGKKYAHLLEKLPLLPVFVDAQGKILSLPPLINSHETGKIDESTEDVFIECSGSDLETLKKTLNIIVTTLADLGGEVYEMEVAYKKGKITTPDLTPEKMNLSLNTVNSLLGLDLKEKDLDKLIPRMGHDYSNGKVSVPAWRVDILHEVDLIEDVAIAYGYDKLVPEVPQVSTVGAESQESKLNDKIAEILTGIGLIELSSYHLIRTDEVEKAQLKDAQRIELENSKTEYKFLRPNLLIPILRILAENKDNEYPQKIFEMGTVFEKGKTETGILESRNLIIASSPANFTELKQILDYLAKMLGVTYSLTEAKNDQLIDGRTGLIHVNNKAIGYIGELHPETLKTWNIKMPVAVIELSIDAIMQSLQSN